MSEVAKILDGIPVELPDGTVIRCRPPTVRAARIIMDAYDRIVRPPLEPPAALPDGAPADAQTLYAAQLASYPDRVVTDEAERRRSWIALLATFPDAIGQPDLADRLSSGDILHLVPDFFWKRTGARVQPTATANGKPVATTGTPVGAPGSPPSA